MNRKQILINIFSNWTNFVVLIVIAFFVSPVMVHRLGDEGYGIWTLVVSLTGYFTVLDFGVNTAIVRFISKYVAQRDARRANEIYSTSFLFFFITSCAVVATTAVLAFFFKTLFSIESFSRTYLAAVFLIVGIDLGMSLLFSVFLGTLQALQQFFKINAISVGVAVARSIAIVLLLVNGYGLLSLALVQLAASASRYLLQHLAIRRGEETLRFRRADCNRETLKLIYNYSVYSFLISIALKLLFYTDSIVIGSLISVAEVTFFAIPATLVAYLEKIVWAAVSVFVPVVSSQEAVGKVEANRNLYLVGTKYSLVMSLPIIFVLFTVGRDFIAIWMGPEYGNRSMLVLQILLVGYVFSLSQLVAHGILKGTSRHAVLAYVLCAEAALNVALSVILARRMGIEGVAVGTAIPMLATNIVAIPLYTCRQLGLSYLPYLFRSYVSPLAAVLLLGLLWWRLGVRLDSYLEIASYSLAVLVLFGSYALLFIVEREHRALLLSKVLRVTGRRSGD